LTPAPRERDKGRVTFWATEDGWPYPDALEDWIDLDSEADDELLNLRIPPRNLFADLDPLERQVISARFGLAGAPVRSMKELLVETGLPREDLRQALGSGLAKLRTHLT
jgi:DNA-directed RNA polymerase sigma subunit (sigma70/sigma32)